MSSSVRVASNCGLLARIFFLAGGFFGLNFLFCGVCNVPDLASLGNTANVCVGSIVYSIQMVIQIINATKGCKVYIMISLQITKAKCG
jgi:hypothetical protein